MDNFPEFIIKQNIDKKVQKFSLGTLFEFYIKNTIT